MSINKAQANALADDFFEDIGGGKDGLQPKETLSEFFQVVGEIIDQAQKNLIKSNSNAGGQLSKSIIADEPTLNGNILSTNIEMLFYGQFVNDGVKGTKSGKGLYKFKSEYPSKDMVSALLKGINRAKKSTTNVSRTKTVSGNEKKNVKISDIAKAYGAARNIKMFGIQPTGFMNDAIAFGRSQIAARLGLALEIDVLNSLNTGDGTNN